MLSILAFTFTMVTGGNDTTTGLLGARCNCWTATPISVVRSSANPV